VNALQYSGYIFDLDGTIYLSERLIPQAREVVEKLRTLSKRIVFLSNKPLQTREEYAAKLTRLGILPPPKSNQLTGLWPNGWPEGPGHIYVIGNIPCC
jgi:ribonucleotide monophosphatase NagD (HAD superfamily)